MIHTAIILAGGLGTRLRSVVSNVPKCMAPVAGKPFLYYVINYLQSQGIEQFIFSVGYKSDMIVEYVSEQFPNLNNQFSIEDEPLGTGGAVKLACRLVKDENVLLLNGDTLFKINLSELATLHIEKNADCSLCLKPMKDFDRYGVVELNNDLAVSAFKEKKAYKTGLINGGVYLLKTSTFLNEDLPEKFSFEKEYLEAFVGERKMYGKVQDEYFIDIGIPEDFERAKREF